MDEELLQELLADPLLAQESWKPLRVGGRKMEDSGGLRSHGGQEPADSLGMEFRARLWVSSGRQRRSLGGAVMRREWVNPNPS